MLEVYSKGVVVAPGAAIPLNTVAVDVGCNEKLVGASTIQFSKCGTYRVTVDCSAVAGAAGDIVIQLYKDGVPQSQAIQTETAADTTSAHAMSFDTFVQVPHKNCPCMGTTDITIVNAGEESVTFDVNVTVA